MNPRALIAEDEPLLAYAMQQALQKAWPELHVVHVAADGQSAAEQALALLPELLFLDIRMPGLTGLEVCERLGEDWPEHTPFPLVVFATAYDEYALKAFEARAVDYLVKPIDAQRLAQACGRLKARLAERVASSNSDPLSELQRILPALRMASASHNADQSSLAVLRANKGSQLVVVPIAEVIALEADDKYVVVHWPQGEALLRTPLKALLPRLDAQTMWQIHRGTVINIRHVQSAKRLEDGRITVHMKGLTKPLTASRLYAHLFKPD